MTDTEQLWQAYATTRDPALRERLLIQYVPLVRYVVSRLTISLPGGTDHEDLISCGTLGLIDAVDRFEPERGVKFECYAIPRVKGSIIDHLRSQGLFTRTTIRAARLMEEALASLHEKLGRSPNEQELAEHLGIEVGDLRQRLADVAPVVVSLDAAMAGDDGEGGSLADTIVDPDSPNPLEIAEDQEAINLLGAAIDNLPERERTVVGLYYHEGLTMKEISLVLGVSESRVSQLHTQAVLRLRAWMRQHVRRMCAVA